jgi:hypothetical protein
MSEERELRVSALVSVYQADRFIAGALEDLTAQTLFRRGELELVIVNADSPGDEEPIIEEYVSHHPEQVRYIRAPRRETLYASWNRAMCYARSEYFTSANVDDRHHPSALEQLATELDQNQEVALVYADCDVTREVPGSFADTPRHGVIRWPDFDPEKLFVYDYIGPQPMWRRVLHQHYGLFEPTLRSAGDYEFWLRACLHEKFAHVPKVLGLFYENPDSLGADPVNYDESEAARDRHWPVDRGLHPKFRAVQPQFERLRQRIETLPPGTKVSLFGAGRHTRRLISRFRWAIEPRASMVTILDDKPAVDEIDGIPVHKPADLSLGDKTALPFDVVIVSSDTHEAALADAACDAVGGRVPVWYLYKDQARLKGKA